MSAMLDKKLVVYPGIDIERAAKVAEKFARDHEDAIGVRNGSVYQTHSEYTAHSMIAKFLYAYQTKTSYVVRDRW